MHLDESKINLEAKKVGEIIGEFYIPSYQRGYRWGVDEVTRLLDDVYSSGTNNYSLQPIVVRKNEGRYELIDGQQRLTTIYLIYKYMHHKSNGFIEKPSFEITYDTREKSEEFLKSEFPENLVLREDNIDFWFMAQAYETIESWHNKMGSTSVILTNINKYFAENVKVIWYAVDDSEDAIALFTRLNIGKIPLTSAELVKALFLSRDRNVDMTREMQNEISLQWDRIERELNDQSFWYFLTNYSVAPYQTRIDLILDLMASKSKESKEKYFTFFYFDELRKTTSLNAIWEDVQRTFLILKDWFEDHELYHKIGYLVTTNSLSLQEIYNLSQGEEETRVTKSNFKSILDRNIKNSIRINENYSELSYEKTADVPKINKLLILFNVESVRQNGEQTQWFPFEKFKFSHYGGVSWSLEHIHAQNSEGMKTQNEWREWLKLHKKSIWDIYGDIQHDLVSEIEIALEKETLLRRDFETLQERIIDVLSPSDTVGLMHTVSNLALLNTRDNAALSNSTFDVKRNLIIEMDRSGKYIPFCTKMVFLKYYTKSEHNQLHFWGKQDRDAYLESINRILENYLENPIAKDWEVE